MSGSAFSMPETPTARSPLHSGLYIGPRWRLLLDERWPLPVFLVVWSGLVVLPLLILFAYSFFTTRYFTTVYRPTLATWTDLFASGRFAVALRTLRIALTVTLIELAVGFPFALWLAKGTRSKGTRAIVLALLTIPFFLDPSSRVIVWRAILDERGLVNWVLLSLGVIRQPMHWMLYTEWSVHFGMVVAYFPMMVLPIFLAISVIDDTLLQAAEDLGASPARVLWDVVMPLSLPGVLAGIVFTLGPALATWVEPSMLGGGFVNMLSNSVESAYTALRVPVVAALSAFVIVLLGVLLGIFALSARRVADFENVFRQMKG